MSAPMAGRLRRAIGMEAVIGVVVLAVTSWMLSTQPGNLHADGVSADGYAYEHDFVDATGKLDMNVAVTPAEVGLNGLLVQVRKPTSEITSITIQFDPPASSGAPGVRMDLTSAQISGAGAAVLDATSGIPLTFAGDWNVTVDVVAADGTFHETSSFTVDPSGDEEIPPITTVAPPVVTSPPGVGTTPTSTTAVATG